MRSLSRKAHCFLMSLNPRSKAIFKRQTPVYTDLNGHTCVGLVFLRTFQTSNKTAANGQHPPKVKEKTTIALKLISCSTTENCLIVAEAWPILAKSLPGEHPTSPTMLSRVINIERITCDLDNPFSPRCPGFLKSVLQPDAPSDPFCQLGKC